MSGLDRGAIVIGTLFIGAGVLFLLEAVDVLTLRPGVLWPIVVIGFGLGIAFGARPSRPEEPPAATTDDPIWRNE
ncbi:MAG: hypothetical protein QNJ88_15940 [Acidimicrobiia bacterium]|nr:hypothetical protein [Acidimicrobiia bacterium]